MTAPVRSISTPDELALFYEGLIDDGPDRNLTYQLLSQAKNRLEVENDLYVLQREDTSKTAAIGDTYTTLHSLPDDWRKTRYMRIGVGVGALKLRPTSFEHRSSEQGNRYFIDYRKSSISAKRFGFTGTLGRGGTVYHGYLIATDDFVTANEDTDMDTFLPWPSEFYPVIAFEAAGFYQTGVDADSISAGMGAVNLARAQNLLDSFLAWDHDQKLAEQDNRAGFADDGDDIDQPVDIGLL